MLGYVILGLVGYVTVGTSMGASTDMYQKFHSDMHKNHGALVVESASFDKIALYSPV